MDPDDAGTKQKWWTQDLSGQITLPGSMTENGLGDDITSTTPWTQTQPRLDEFFRDPRFAPYLKTDPVKIPFWLTPVKYYKGAAWYQRDIVVPEDWAAYGISLYLERVHWFSQAWINDQEVRQDFNHIGNRNSLSVAHVWNLGQLKPGKHRLTIRVDNRVHIPVGLNAHSVTDHTQTNWNGIVGRIELHPYDSIQLSAVKIEPDHSGKSVKVQLQTNVTMPGLGKVQGNVVITDPDGEPVAERIFEGPFAASKVPYTASHSRSLELKKPALPWDEFSPNLYKADVRLVEHSDDGTTKLLDSRTETFGFRDFSTSGTEFVVNGRPTFLRGTLECCIFPLTGYPPMEIEPWRRIMRIIKAHGLNHLRFHSWCPPEAAFDAADEAGVYFSIECASWAHPGEDKEYDEWLYAECERILREYGNHPSFCMLLYGNEPGGDKKTYHKFLTEFVDHWKEKENRILISGGAGWPDLKNNEFYITQKPRIQAWGAGLKSRVNALPPETVTDYSDFIAKHKMPVISHEIGQWCAYPNLKERSKYTGVTRAYNFDIFADSLAAHHMADQADDFLMASGKLQAALYKEDIESALRTRGMGGFQLLDLHDFPGQGTALVGVLDAFWDSKGYISAEEYRRFAGPVVPLARLSKRVFTNDEHLTCTVELANYSSAPLTVAPRWSLDLADGSNIASSEFDRQTFPVRNGLPLGMIDQPLDGVTKAAKVVLTVSLPGTDYINSWDVWVYPNAKDVDVVPKDDIMVTNELDENAMDRLNSGGKVLLMAADKVRDPASGKIQAGFSSIFWNTAWTGGQAPHTLGILCDPKNPALASFPTDFHSNWQWWYLLGGNPGTPVMVLDGLPKDVRPIVQSIDDWTTNHRLGYIWEANYGGGKLLVSSIFLVEPAEWHPVPRQMLHSLLEYMESDKFDPKITINQEQLETVLELP